MKRDYPIVFSGGGTETFYRECIGFDLRKFMQANIEIRIGAIIDRSAASPIWANVYYDVIWNKTFTSKQLEDSCEKLCITSPQE